MVKALIPWGLLFGLFFIINPFPSFLPAYNEFKFIGLPVMGIFLWSYYRPSLKTIDIFLLAFVIFVCVSLIDAKVISLSWQPMFNWISIVFLTIGLRPLLQQYQKEIFELFHAAFGLMVLLIGIGIYLKIPSTINQNWVDFAGQNINYCAVMPIIFGTTFIFYPHKSLWWLIPKLISIGVLLHFVDYFRSGLGLVLLAFIIPIFVLKILPPKLRLVFVGLGIVVGIFFLPKDWIDVFWAKLDEYASGKDIRVYNSMISWIAFKEHWYNGMGAGNWILSVFEYIPDMEIPYESFKIGLFHKRSHEFLFRLGSEIGVFGFLCFIVPFFWVVVKTLKSPKILDSILLAPLMTITVIFSCFFTFEIVESNEQTYNETLQMLF